MLILLKELAERAEGASIEGKLVVIDVGKEGITIAGKMFLPGLTCGAPRRTWSTMQLSSWEAITTGGIFPLRQAMDRVIHDLDAAAAKR